MEKLINTCRFTASLLTRQWLAPGVLELQLTRPSHITFIPGQFVRFIMDGYERDYTMVSTANAETMDFCIAIVDKGRFSRDILKVDIGATFQLSGPHGHFIFEASANPAVFVATGTGIAPFVAFCRAGVDAALLLHGVGTAEQLIYRDLLQSHFRGYVPCISRPFESDAGLEKAFSGRVTRYLEEHLRPGIFDFYLCGRGDMIRDVAALVDDRFSESRLFIETYD